MTNPVESVALSQISKDHLQSLIDDGVREGRRLDYKAQLYRGNDEGSREFLRDVVSFANTEGGHLILGVTEEDGEAVGIPGIEFSPDKVIPALDSKIQSSIEPRILGVAMQPIRVDDDHFVLVVRIPQSWNRPHRVSYKGRSHFWARNNGGKYPMEMTEIQAQVLGGSAIAERLAKFRTERVRVIASNEGPAELSAGVKVILHAVPFASFGTGRAQSLPDRHAIRNLMYPIGEEQGLDDRINFDGLIGLVGRPPTAYLRVFRQGMVETVNTDLATLRDGGKYLIGPYLDEQVEEAVGRISGLLREIEVSPPVAWVLTLLGVKGYEIMIPYSIGRFQPLTIDRDELGVPEVVDLDMTMDSTSIAQRLMDPVWQAGGWERTRTFEKRKHGAN